MGYDYVINRLKNIIIEKGMIPSAPTAKYNRYCGEYFMP